MWFAQESPLMKIFSNYASYLIGDVGVTLFFWLLFFVGVILRFQMNRMKFVIKMFLVLLVLLSSLLNFPVLDTGNTSYQQFGWFISYPLFYVLNQMFGWSVTAIKGFVVLLALLYFAYLWYVFRIPVPSFDLSVKSNDKKYRHSGQSVGDTVSPTFSLSQSFLKKSLSTSRASWSSLSTSKVLSDWKNLQEKNLLKSIIDSKINSKQQETSILKMKQIDFPSDKPTFSYNLLSLDSSNLHSLDNNFLLTKAKWLQDKLLEFNVPISIDGFDIGPSIIQIRIRPEAGIKVSAIENLQNDIALSLKAKALRIVSPVPGTDCVGIQIPNPQPQIVRLGDALHSSLFLNSMKDNLTNLCLWKEINGKFVVKSLEKMPHLLIAWATWSGKSVWVNDFVLALMYQNTPSELKFLMVDPKQVEMEFYWWLPYLLAPIITDADKALRMLKWSVEEMEFRYKQLTSIRVKNLDEYNQKKPDDKMYRIVIVIDELADLMMSGYKKDTELCITRIAQKARAVGMHLIVATQRPSVNVITGLIKANMPTRIAFWVVSQIDSRTILWIKWAEELVGRWDLLFMDTTTKYPVRIQAPFVDTPEIEKVVWDLKRRYMNGIDEKDIYHPELLSVLDGKKNLSLDSRSWDFSSSGDSDEDLIEQAIQLISETRKASATMLQRKLNVWFARAARIMDSLEERGVVGPQDGAKPRDILL